MVKFGDVGIWRSLLLGKKGKSKRRRYSCDFRMDVQSGKALEELHSALFLSWLEFPHLPFTIPQYVRSLFIHSCLCFFLFLNLFMIR